MKAGGKREPRTIGGSRITMLDCQLGQHSGPFTINRTILGWACDDCIRKAWTERGILLSPESPA